MLKVIIGAMISLIRNAEVQRRKKLNKVPLTSSLS